MIENRPRVSIGLPVYNGENYLEEALAAILAQTFTDFEVIISDNASTDRTREICEAHVAREPRLRYYRSPVNHGAAWNFNRTFELARGEYFKWVAHDDSIEPTFLAKCVDVLDRDPSTILCFCNAQVIDETGKVIAMVAPELATKSHKPHKRYRDLVLHWHGCLDVFGLIRADALRTTKLIDSYAASDRVLLADLSLLGRFERILESLFTSRVHSGQSSQVHLLTGKGKIDLHSYTTWFDATKANQIVFPQWKLLFEYSRIVWHRELPAATRLLCHLYLARWSLNCGRALAADIIIGARQFLRSAGRRGQRPLTLPQNTGRETQ